MTSRLNLCPIWNTNVATDTGYKVSGCFDHRAEVNRVDYSARAAGGYVLPGVLVNSKLIWMSEQQKAQLTTWLIDQRMQGVEFPENSESVIEYAKNKPPLPVHERADRLLKHLAEESKTVGQVLCIGCEGDYAPNGGWAPQDPLTAWTAMAWSESLQWEEVRFLTKYLAEQNWIEVPSIGGRWVQVNVTVEGYSHIADVSVNRNLSQVFVAMWFDDSMNESYQSGIEQAVWDAGYKPFRIDQKEHINKIDDEIIAEIRRSRFLVADFTQGSDGARGGVYYEAGFAQGLGLPVIFTCRENSVQTLHFDTNHYNHIVWNTPEELCANLKNRILAVIGEGPEAHKNS